MPARESFRSWMFDVRHSMFNDKQMSNNLTGEEIRGMLTVTAVAPVHLEIRDVEALAANYRDGADGLRAFQKGSGN
jgi:hypothetical protein